MKKIFLITSLLVLFCGCSENEEILELDRVAFMLDGFEFEAEEINGVYNSIQDQLVISAKDGEILLEIKLNKLSQISEGPMDLDFESYIIYHEEESVSISFDLQGNISELININSIDLENQRIEGTFDNWLTGGATIEDGIFDIGYCISEKEDSFNVLVNGDVKTFENNEFTVLFSDFEEVHIGFQLSNHLLSESIALFFDKNVEVLSLIHI